MRFLLHIGRPKTGTSSLQNFLFHNKAVLVQHGFCYVHAPWKSNANMYFEPLHKGAERRVGMAGLADHIAEARAHIQSLAQRGDVTNVISAEAMSNLSPRMIDAVFQGCELQIVSYLRNELDFIASGYAQRIQAEWIDLAIEDYLAPRGRMSNHHHLQEFTDHYGTCFTPLLYARDALAQGSVEQDFLEKALKLIQTGAFTFHPSQNPSITDQVIVFKRRLVRESRAEFQKGRCYNAFAQLSRTYGKPYRLPAIAKEMVLPDILRHATEWQRRYFGRDDIFDYHAYDYSEDDAGPEIDFDAMLADLTRMLAPT